MREIELILKNVMERHGIKEWTHYQKPERDFSVGIVTKPQVVKEKAFKIEQELEEDLEPIRFVIDNAL